VRRRADDRVRADDRAGVLDGQVVLTNVNTVSARETRDVGPIVDDELRAGIVGEPDERFGKRQPCGARWRLVAKLQQPGAAAEAGRRELVGIDPTALAEARINNDVERCQTASARPALPVVFFSTT
jgi:hypothetical protein